MKNKLLIILGVLLITSLISCSDDKKTFEGYTKAELNGTSSCTSKYKVYGSVKKMQGTVLLHEDKELIIGKISAYLKDKDGKLYWACGLPEAYRINGQEIIFSGVIYYDNPAANTYNPLLGAEFEITELWIRDPYEY